MTFLHLLCCLIHTKPICQDPSWCGKKLKSLPAKKVIKSLKKSCQTGFAASKVFKAENLPSQPQHFFKFQTSSSFHFLRNLFYFYFPPEILSFPKITTLKFCHSCYTSDQGNKNVWCLSRVTINVLLKLFNLRVFHFRQGDGYLGAWGQGTSKTRLPWCAPRILHFSVLHVRDFQKCPW